MEMKNVGEADGWEMRNTCEAGGWEMKNAGGAGGWEMRNNCEAGGWEMKNAGGADGWEMRNTCEAGGWEMKNAGGADGWEMRNNCEAGGWEMKNAGGADGWEMRNTGGAGGWEINMIVRSMWVEYMFSVIKLTRVSLYMSPWTCFLKSVLVPQVLRLVHCLVSFGYYGDMDDMKQLLIPLLSLLDGRNDKLYPETAGMELLLLSKIDWFHILEYFCHLHNVIVMVHSSIVARTSYLLLDVAHMGYRVGQ